MKRLREQAAIDVLRLLILNWQEKVAKINGATQAAVTKLDSLFPKCQGIREFDALPSEAKQFIREIENTAGVPVVLIGTGPDALDIIDRRK